MFPYPEIRFGKPSPSMRVLITEEALQTGKGHWPVYIGGIAGGLRAAGDEVEILGHRDASGPLRAEPGVTPWFRRNCWLDPRSQGALGGIRHNLSFRADMCRWLKLHQPYDWICALTMRLQHLLAFALLARSGAVAPGTRFLLLFVQGFGSYAGPGHPTVFPKSASNLLARWCFRLLAPAVRSGRVVLAAETDGMQDELQRFTGLPVALFPHPVEGLSGAAPHAPLDIARTPLTITCPGFARHEKGNDLLQDAIKSILAGPDGNRFRFIMQWPEPFALPDGRMLGPDPQLLADPRVEFLNEPLDAAAYESLLARSDLVILPYRRESYHHRVSRVAIEASSRGIPLVYTSGTWSARIAELAGCGEEIPDETADAVVLALKSAADAFEALRTHAAAGAARVASFHSASRFRARLLEHTNA